MDTLTHALLGAAVGAVAGGRQLGWRAPVAALVAAELPDLDFFIRSAADPLVNVELHRHFTHSFAFSPIIAFVAVLPWFFRAEFQPARGALMLCGLIGCWSHILLDACTSYGTQFLVPFSNARFGWDFISIVDPIFTLALLAGLGLRWLAARRAARMDGGAHSGNAGATFVWLALGFCAAYLALGAVQKSRAHAAQAELAQQRGHRIERSEAMPTLANQIVWRSLYLHNGHIHSDRLRVPWLGPPTVREGSSLPLVSVRDLTPAEAARDAERPSFARFAHFSDAWVARAPGDATVIGDMRYSLSAKAFDPIWGIRFTSPGAPTAVEWVNRSRDRRVALAELWEEMTGRNPDYRPLSPVPAAATQPVNEPKEKN